MAGERPVLTLTLKVCESSLVVSAIGVTVKVPTPRALILKVPVSVVKSDASAEPVLYAQYNSVPLATLVVVTVNVIGEPSSTEVIPAGGDTAYPGAGGGV